jgi:DNA-binding CsgD family transcriptional regulator
MAFERRNAGERRRVTEARAALRRAVLILDKTEAAPRNDVLAQRPDVRRAIGDRGPWRLVDDIKHAGRRYIIVAGVSVEGAAALTERERQVVAWAQRGHHNKVIAHELGISHSTVRVLLARAAKRLAVRTRQDLLRVCAVVDGSGAGGS